MTVPFDLPMLAIAAAVVFGSYVLFGIRKSILARTLFPVGGYRKEEIRALADYNNALAALAHREGTTLQRHNVTFNTQ